MKFYEAQAGAILVYVYPKEGSTHRRPLASRLDVRNHSPDGFAWGYMGSGPSQLALALLIDVFDDVEFACRYYHEFKRRVIAPMDGTKGWTLTEETIRATIDKIQEEGSA